MPNISKIDLNLLVVLDAIHAEGGVSRAAEKLNLTQPAISQALGRLRDLFGDPLFVRRGQGLIPTPLARNLIGPLRATLQSLETTINQSGRFEPAESTQRFVIGMRDMMEATFLPPLMAAFAQQAPKAECISTRVTRRDLEAELDAGTVDAALDVFLPLAGNIKSKRIARDDLVVLARKNHPGLKRGCTLDSYLKQRHVLVTSRRERLGAEDVELRRRGLNRDIALRCQFYTAACAILQQGDLLLTVAERYARLLARDFDLKLYPLPFDAPKFDLYLYWHSNVDADPANKWLRQQILAAFGE